MNTTLQRWGNSQGIRIPKKLVEAMGTEVGAPLRLELAEGGSKLVVSPTKKRRPVRGRHRIEDLVAKGNGEAFEGEVDWGESVGKEVW